jgi:microcystin-dependent protein
MKALPAVLMLLAGSLAALAEVPALMSYQARVSDASGTLIGATTPANRTVTFKFYPASTGGTPVYTEAQTVTISGGEFSVLLGSGTGVSGLKGPSAPATTPYITLQSVMDGNLYLGITVDDGTNAADAEITPRQQIVSAAYAFRAKIAEGLPDGQLATSMLANSSVTVDKLGGNAVTTAKLANDAVDQSKILNGSVATSKLADGSVTNPKLAANSVSADKIVDGTITHLDILDGSLNGNEIADGSIGSIDIGDGQIQTVDLAGSAVTTDKVANNAIDYAKLAAAVQQSLCPVGTILPFAGDTAPAGWLLCNGASVNRTTYATLYAVVGNRFGSADDSSFNIPDFRGRFLRGRDGGAGVDPDRNSRTAMKPGGAVGDLVGSVQDQSVQNHNHGYNDIYHSENGGNGAIFTNGKGSGDTDNDNEPYEISRTSNSTGGNETRPLNANVNYIIKF